MREGGREEGDVPRYKRSASRLGPGGGRPGGILIYLEKDGRMRS
jgi:hypothetical protein